MNKQDPINKHLTKEDAVYTPEEGFKRTLIFFHGLTSDGQKMYDKFLSGKEMRPCPLVFLLFSVNSLGFQTSFSNSSN